MVFSLSLVSDSFFSKNCSFFLCALRKKFHSLFLLRCVYFLSGCMYECLCEFLCVMLQVHDEVKGHQIPWDWRLGSCEWHAWVLRTKLRSVVRADLLLTSEPCL